MAYGCSRSGQWRCSKPCGSKAFRFTRLRAMPWLTAGVGFWLSKVLIFGLDALIPTSSAFWLQVTECLWSSSPVLGFQAGNMVRAEKFVARMEKDAKAQSKWLQKDIATQLAAPNEQVLLFLCLVSWFPWCSFFFSFLFLSATPSPPLLPPVYFPPVFFQTHSMGALGLLFFCLSSSDVSYSG